MLTLRTKGMLCVIAIFCNSLGVLAALANRPLMALSLFIAPLLIAITAASIISDLNHTPQAPRIASDEQPLVADASPMVETELPTTLTAPAAEEVSLGWNN